MVASLVVLFYTHNGKSKFFFIEEDFEEEIKGWDYTVVYMEEEDFALGIDFEEADNEEIRILERKAQIERLQRRREERAV